MKSILAGYVFCLAASAIAVLVFRHNSFVPDKGRLYASTLLYPPLALVAGLIVPPAAAAIAMVVAVLLTDRTLPDATGRGLPGMRLETWCAVWLLELVLPLGVYFIGDQFERERTNLYASVGVLLCAAVLFIFFRRAHGVKSLN